MIRFYLFLAAAAAVLIAIGAIRHSGVSAERERNAKVVVQQVDARKKEIGVWEFNATARRLKSEEDLKTAQADVARVTKLNNELRRKQYVNKAAMDACRALTVGVVRYHDAAAAGRAALPDPAGAIIDADSGVGIDRYSEVVSNNYGAYHAVTKRLESCEQWVVNECEAWNKKWGSKTQCRGVETQPGKIPAPP